MTAVHDLTEEISQIFPRNFGASFKIVVQHIQTNSQVARIEWIDPIPALGTEFSSFQNHGMEITKRKQDWLKFCLLGTAFQGFLE